MKNEKTTLLSNGLIWFGAGVSIAEILTGILIAPLGLKKGVLAIVLGHLIGCILFFLAGLVGARTEKASMETVKISFGNKAYKLFAILNVIQLVGWTAVMIVNGANAANEIFHFGSPVIWCILIGVLIIVWTFIGMKNLSKINIIAMALLFILTLCLTYKLCVTGNVSNDKDFLDTISFGAAVELSVAMPISWLPLFSDYTSKAEKPEKAAVLSSIVYFITSSWMYIIGLLAAIIFSESDISKIMILAGLGVSSLFVIVFSTVTTTFLDTFSAGVSFKSIFEKYNEKKVSVLVCVIGVVMAIFIPVNKFESFLYLIGSVFSPMIAILISDYFILKKDYTDIPINNSNIVIWIIGIIIYRVFLNIVTPIGNTAPVIIIICIIKIIFEKIIKKENSTNIN